MRFDQLQSDENHVVEVDKPVLSQQRFVALDKPGELFVLLPVAAAVPVEMCATVLVSPGPPALGPLIRADFSRDRPCEEPFLLARGGDLEVGREIDSRERRVWDDDSLQAERMDRAD